MFEGRDVGEKRRTKGLGEVMAIGEAVIGFFGDALEDDLVEGFGDIGPKGGGGLGGGEEMAREQLVAVVDLVGVTGKWGMSDDRFIQANTHAIDICPRIGDLTAKLFGRDIEQGSKQRAGLGEFMVIKGASDPEVGEFHDETFAKEDI